jgi:hypothetical protein
MQGTTHPTSQCDPTENFSLQQNLKSYKYEFFFGGGEGV